MLELFRHLGWQKLAIEQLLPMAAALVIAELFYKFHSFTLECLAFVATWLALEFAVSAFLPKRRSEQVSKQARL